MTVQGDDEGVLAGVKVVEFAQNVAVPHCGRLFAGMGADVVKVEPPVGDAMRHLASLAPAESRAFATINPGKRAIVVDLGSPDAAPIVDRLLAWADVALIGLKAPDVVRYGLDWEHARSVNPGLVALIFTAFGPQGPDADARGYDMLVQATSGLGFSMNRTSDGVPLPTRPAVIDFASGAMAATAVLGALRHRDRTGVGQRVDASLLGTAMSLGITFLNRFDTDRERMVEIREDVDLMRSSGASFEEWRAQYERRVVAGGGTFKLYTRPYETADGLISLAAFSPALMARFHEITGVDRPPDLDDPSADEFIAAVEAAEALFRSKTTEHWMAVLQQAGYPCARFQYPQEAIEDPQALANEYVVDLDHPVIGGYRTVGMPFSYSDARTEVARSSPALGEHIDQVMAEIGFDPATVQDLRQRGVFGE